MSNNIEGKVVVITGASSGLGEATTRFLSGRGAIVVPGARRVDRLQSLADELNASGRSKATGSLLFGRQGNGSPTLHTLRNFFLVPPEEILSVIRIIRLAPLNSWGDWVRAFFLQENS